MQPENNTSKPELATRHWVIIYTIREALKLCWSPLWDVVIKNNLVNLACTDKRLLSPTQGCMTDLIPATICALWVLRTFKGWASSLKAAASASCPLFFPKIPPWLNISSLTSSNKSHSWLSMCFLCILMYGNLMSKGWLLVSWRLFNLSYIHGTQMTYFVTLLLPPVLVK